MILCFRVDLSHCGSRPSLQETFHAHHVRLFALRQTINETASRWCARGQSPFLSPIDLRTPFLLSDVSFPLLSPYLSVVPYSFGQLLRRGRCPVEYKGYGLSTVCTRLEPFPIPDRFVRTYPLIQIHSLSFPLFCQAITAKGRMSLEYKGYVLSMVRTQPKLLPYA